MTVNLTKHKEDLLFLPLGGSNEIGMNLNLYHLDGKWLMIDCGAGFADDYLPGVDMIVPNIDFLLEHKKDLLGIVLTHAHEDHLGGIQYLWNELRCPVYTTAFTAAFLRLRLKETSFYKDIKIIELAPKSKLQIGPFMLDLVPLNHSAPEMNAIMVRTRHGNVFHTGDWKFDHDPLITESNDEVMLKSYGDEGVLAMVGDSTNVFNPGHSGSEGDLRKSLVNLIEKCENLVVVTTFASNLARVDTIIKAAENAGRRVMIAGKSLWRIIAAAKDSGYLQDIPELLEDSQFRSYARKELVVIATGCQGESMAAMNKFASDAHPTIRLAPNDTVIFSSKIIPGNDKRIYRLFNLLVEKGVEVLTEKDHFVHVSGHPGCEELMKMYQLIRPEVAIPVHGELIHLHEHARLATSFGARSSLMVRNGDILKIAPGRAEKIGQAESGYLAIDGNYLIPSTSEVLRMRRKMRDNGIIFVSLVISKDYNLKLTPVISAPGVLPNDDDELISELKEEIKDVVTSSVKSKNKMSKDILENLVRSAVNRIVRNEMGKKPHIQIMIVVVA